MGGPGKRGDKSEGLGEGNSSKDAANSRKESIGGLAGPAATGLNDSTKVRASSRKESIEGLAGPAATGLDESTKVRASSRKESIGGLEKLGLGLVTGLRQSSERVLGDYRLDLLNCRKTSYFARNAVGRWTGKQK